MKLLTVFLLLFFAANTILAQSKKVEKAAKPKPSMADLYNKDDGGACYPLKPPTLSGTVVKRQYDEDEITLIGFVLKEPGDDRTFVNVDHEYVGKKGRFVPEELLQFVKPGNRVKIWVYGCGASGRLLMLEKIQIL